jgi:integrase/recombinase XerD
MPPLRKRMIEDRQLRGLSERPQEASVRAVRHRAAHSHKSPDRITEADLRDDVLSLKNVKPYSRSASPIALGGVTCFSAHTLKRDWSTRSFVRAQREKKLPVILSPQEVRRILQQVTLLRYRVCLTPIYACGLRLQEGPHRQGANSDSARMLVHVRHGTGAQDRSVPLPRRTVAL